MILRPQTVRRLMVLLAAVLLMVGAGAALYLRNEHRKQRRLSDAREAGLAAFKANDYKAALESLKYYVARDKNDPETLYAYGVSRSRLEEPNGKHIVEGIAVFNALLQIDPNNLDAKHSLLDLYTQAYYGNEAVDLADRILLDRPDDVPALKAQAVALDRLRQYEKALAASEKLNELQPTDLDQQLTTYELMRKLKTPPAALLVRAQKQQAAHPDDPRFAMLLAMAHGNAGDIAQGKQWLTKAATQPAPDAPFVRHMVRVLDSLKMYKESEDLLGRVTAQNPDPLIMRVLVQRRWQGGQSGEVIKLLKDVDPASDTADTGLLAYKALALFETGKKDEANAIVGALAKRKTDSDAVAWSTALAARFDAQQPPKAQLAQYQAALVRSPDNAVVRFLVGEAYARLGETELAIGAWRRAAELAPAWATPHIDIARTLAAGGRLKEAFLEAQAAVRAAPSHLPAAITLATIRHKSLEELGSDDANEEARLLALVEQIQKTAPGEAETLPIYANLLAHANRRDEAIAAVRTVTKNSKKYDQATVLRMLAVSRAHKLGLENELQSVGDDGKDTPRVALARAADLASTGKPQDGLALIQSKAKAATTQPTEWELAVIQYKELIRDPGVAAEWVAFGDAHPNDLSVQNAILKAATSARRNREFFARTIDRVKALTGPEGQTWKLERARWLLGGDGGKDTAEAVNTLTEIVRNSPTLTEARLLLGAAYENVGNVAGATKELQTASELEANSASIAIEAARLLQSQNRFGDARTYLERASATPDLQPEARRRIASMFASQGDFVRGAKLLESAGDELETPGTLLLAEIYRREKRLSDADAIYTKLLAADPVETETIRAAADFYASQQKIDAAMKVLARLPQAKGKPGMAELTRAAFHERYLNADAAREHYVAATTAAPKDPITWRNLVGYELRSDKYEDARAAAEAGLKAVDGDDAALRRLRTVSDSLAKLNSQHDAALRPVLAVLAAAAPEDRAVSEFLSAQNDATSKPTTDNILARLKSTAERYPRSLPLQSALIQWHVGRKDFAEAGKAAARAMDSFPQDADAARIAGTVYRSAGQLELAAAAAAKWRERIAADNPQPADWMLAEIRLAQGDAVGAQKALQPYAVALTTNPQQNPAMLATLLRAYVLGGRERDARAALEPALAKERSARVTWLQLASTDIKDPNIAAEWVRHVAPLVPADAVQEQVALGSAWYSLAVRGRIDGAADEAAKALDAVAKRPDAPAEAILLRAAVYDRTGDTKTAEELYRRGLAVSPDRPEALNNLAYLVLLRGGDLNESKQLVTRAVEIAPKTSNFHDTLGRVQAKLGEREAAIASFQKALDLEPNNLEALIGLATTFTDAGKRDAAAALLPQIDTLLKSRPSLSPPVRRELETLRATMKASL
jgi:tetratricopeptide (TPR) repeat protein